MKNRIEYVLERIIFASRWVQLPLYIGLIAAALLYSYKFYIELWHLFSHIDSISEEMLMLAVLGLIDVTMVANLLIMVIIGGYSTFVSRLETDEHRDHPEWLEKIGAGTLKVKLAGALAGVSGIHLLKSFVNIANRDTEQVMWQVIIHAVFLVSTIALAWADRIMHSDHGSPDENHDH
ncbi:MAG: TIGR00645 family protein [Leptonema illini]|jgi:uncharacterized protein (TIGR00645 family)|uniref:UPF0114 protein F9K24_00165 n=1 Tax=Leptonema illini TaxID=183 RepID=A0A833H503_9LEPT|nr:MAG: TIGR00645 family protein [Leptonema illini]